MPFFTKKPVTIEARQHDGTEQSAKDLVAWIVSCGHEARWDDGHGLLIETLEGTHHASPGDFVIKGVKGEFYPCKEDIFLQSYDPAVQAAAA
jgi:hypothetical protein